MPNQLAHETSPYLLQHQDNPVDWYPWGPEALQRARREDKPIFLSIGYSACHWCHVMEHESFEDPEIARELNDKFICVKVDREERPDLDQIYMNAVQLMTGRGGWPMSMFLTPDLKPFYGGTYWPPQPRMGMPGFLEVVRAVDEAWKTRRQAADEQAEQLTQRLSEMARLAAAPGSLNRELLWGAAEQLQRSFDPHHGGFGGAPKFPHAMDLQLLLRLWRRRPRQNLLDMATLTLDKMADGGIYDHLGGGFARYSVDARWLVPHFEKMLYDNALLAGAYLDGYLATGNARYARVVRETLDYVLRDMTDPAGAFHSSEDADSEGEEGKFYLWTADEIQHVLGQDAAERFCYVYDVSDGGNFEGKNILHLPKSIEQCAAVRGWDAEQLEAELAESRLKLLEVRNRRVRPGKDDKVLVSWNGLMIDSMARAAAVFQEPRYAEAASGAAKFLFDALQIDNGRLLHCWRRGEAKLAAYLDDYAYLANALVTLHQTTFEEVWIDRAVQLGEIMLAHFHDQQSGGFYFTADDHEKLITRQKDVQDASVPSGNAMAATALIRMGKLCGRPDFLEAAAGTLGQAAGTMAQFPTAMGQMLLATDMWLGPLFEVAMLADPKQDETVELLQDLRNRWSAHHVLAVRNQPDSGSSRALDPLFEGKTSSDQPAVYLCENFACAAPAIGAAAVRQTWQQLQEAGKEEIPDR